MSPPDFTCQPGQKPFHENPRLVEKGSFPWRFQQDLPRAVRTKQSWFENGVMWLAIFHRSFVLHTWFERSCDTVSWPKGLFLQNQEGRWPLWRWRRSSLSPLSHLHERSSYHWVHPYEYSKSRILRDLGHAILSRSIAPSDVLIWTSLYCTLFLGYAPIT